MDAPTPDPTPPATPPPASVKKKYRSKRLEAEDIPTAAQVMKSIELLQLRTHSRFPRNRVRLIVLVMLSACGLRASELATLEMEEVRCDVLERPCVKLATGKVKNRRPRTIPLKCARRVVPIIQAWKRQRELEGAGDGDPFIVGLDKKTRGRPLDRHQVYRYAVSVMRWRFNPFWQPGFNAHSLRHFFASYCIVDKRIGIGRTRDYLGHESLQETSRYVHDMPDTLTYSDIFDLPEASTDGPGEPTTRP